MLRRHLRPVQRGPLEGRDRAALAGQKRRKTIPSGDGAKQAHDYGYDDVV